MTTAHSVKRKRATHVAVTASATDNILPPVFKHARIQLRERLVPADPDLQQFGLITVAMRASREGPKADDYCRVRPPSLLEPPFFQSPGSPSPSLPFHHYQ